MTIEKIRKKTDVISLSQHENEECSSLDTRDSENPRGSIRWPRSGRLSNEVRVTTIELMVEKMTDNNNWAALATTLSKLVGVRKFQINPTEGILLLQFNQEHVNLRKIQHLLKSYGYEIKPASTSEPAEQKIPLSLKSV